MIIFTSICANYIHKARTLAASVKQNIPDALFFVCLTEKEKGDYTEYEFFDEVILSRDMWKGNFEQFIFKHSIVEASTAVKARFFQYLMETYLDETAFVYLDPDCYVYSDFIELREVLKTRPVVLCPHLLQPGNIDMELSSTAHGVFNLGFLAVNHTDEAKRLIDWWAERLYLFCYDDIQRGIFTDQKWMDLAPCFFDVEIFKHKGYDFAPWSLLDCGMNKDGDRYYVKGEPLRFIHFSGYGATAQKCMREWLPEGPHPFKDLYKEYSILHNRNDKDQVSKVKWSYDYYQSGEKINNKLRLKYRSNYNVMFHVDNPFLSNNCNLGQLLRKRKTIKYYWNIFQTIVKKEGFGNLIIKLKQKIL